MFNTLTSFNIDIFDREFKKVKVKEEFDLTFQVYTFFFFFNQKIDLMIVFS